TAGVVTRRKLKESASDQHQALLSFIYKQNRTNHKDQQTCLFACFLSQEEPKKVSQALADESWVEAMQEELLQFRLQDVWVLCDLPDGKRVIGTKWVFRNKRDERGTIIKNKARLVAQGYRQEEGVDYDESSQGTLWLTSSPKSMVYVDDIIFGSTKPSMVKDFEELMQKEFKMSSMGELTFLVWLQVKQTTAGIFLSQDKYVKDILNKFDFRNIKPASTPIEAHKSLGKDEEGEEFDVHLYRSMIGCLMYLTASRPDIMFAVYSDYVGDNHDIQKKKKPINFRDVNIVGRRLVSCNARNKQCAISSTEAEYVAAASCCAQVLWMQNQLLDYGFNFMNTEIHIDNESTICIVKNPVLHSKTKHIQIRHHFIRDCYEQRLINVVKTVHNADFYQIIDYLTGCSIHYSLLVDPDLIGPWLQQFWATASLRVINKVPHIRACSWEKI
ncbi:putative ribonuclease H-like domain-containing protein, partial [Tanacetum coccineum]